MVKGISWLAWMRIAGASKSLSLQAAHNSVSLNKDFQIISMASSCLSIPSVKIRLSVSNIQKKDFKHTRIPSMLQQCKTKAEVKSHVQLSQSMSGLRASSSSEYTFGIPIRGSSCHRIRKLFIKWCVLSLANKASALPGSWVPSKSIFGIINQVNES